MTGSKSVITLNLNRITQNWYKTFEKNRNIFSFRTYLNDILERVLKYHVAYNELLWDMCNAGLLPAYTAGFIDLNKQYLTIGINGLNQAAEFLKLECTNNKRYRKFCNILFSTIKDFNSAHNGKYFNHKVTLNTECVPRHCGHNKPLLIDSKLLIGQRGASREIVQPERLNKVAA